jgi:hypothetical protein
VTPVLITFSNSLEVWTVLEEHETLKGLKYRINAERLIPVSEQRPIGGGWDSVETLLNWNHIIGLTKFPELA